jgi:hypothetical protein
MMTAAITDVMPHIAPSASGRSKWMTTAEGAQYLSVEPRTLALWARQSQRPRSLRYPPNHMALLALRPGCYDALAVCCSHEREDSVKQRNRSGSVVLDKRIKRWNFFWWENGKRRSKQIGTTSQYPTKASAWRAAKPLRDAVENQEQVNPGNAAPTISTLVEQYRAEKMPKRLDTRRTYNAWLKNHIVPRWGACEITTVQARPAELWLQSLALSPKS